MTFYDDLIAGGDADPRTLVRVDRAVPGVGSGAARPQVTTPV
jgi:hypothetical protein